MTSNVDALPDNKIIVNIISQPHIESGGGAYSQNILVKEVKKIGGEHTV